MKRAQLEVSTISFIVREISQMDLVGGSNACTALATRIGLSSLLQRLGSGALEDEKQVRNQLKNVWMPQGVSLHALWQKNKPSEVFATTFEILEILLAAQPQVSFFYIAFFFQFLLCN